MGEQECYPRTPCILDAEVRKEIPTCPVPTRNARFCAARALKWASEQQAWLSEQVGKSAVPVLVVPGARLPVFGVERRVEWAPQAPRAVRVEGDALHLGGPEETVGRRIERWLKAEALDLMAHESHEIAERAGLRVGRVGVGDPRSRWGSCSSTARLSFSWRLIFAPREVMEYVVAHEVAHLRHMNHSPAFWNAVSVLCPDYDAAKDWLKMHGKDLYRFNA